MNDRYWLYQRGRMFYIQDRTTGKQQSLRTKDRATAQRLFQACNQAWEQPTHNVAMASLPDREIGRDGGADLGCGISGHGRGLSARPLAGPLVHGAE